MADDLTLLQRWRNGDRAAGEALVRKHYRPICEYLLSEVHGNADLAGELTQQVFEVAVTNRDDIVTNFRAYLKGVARYKLWAHFRRRPASSDDPTPAPSQLADPGRGAFSVLLEQDNAKLLVRVLRSLSIEEQAYLMWYYADKLTQAQIAEQVGLSASQVNGRITRAREKLRRQLEELSHSAAQRGSLDKGFDTWMMSLRRRVAEGDGKHQSE